MRLLIDALACYRLTRLVTQDTLTAEPRDAVIRWAYRRSSRWEWAKDTFAFSDGFQHTTWAEDVVPNDESPPKLAVLTTCPWCASVWLAFGIVALRRLFPRWWGPVAEGLALSAVAGVVSEKVGR